ncbi:MAG: hypothetical protein QOJ64_1624 [Acidobacteriota bacterium]|nr:hypothetical protein [Acidobacteriota bacterium]
MNRVMKRLILAAGCILLVWTMACKCSPPITAQKIEADIVGKTISIEGYNTGKPDTWTFEKGWRYEDNYCGKQLSLGCRQNYRRHQDPRLSRHRAGHGIRKAAAILRAGGERVGPR